MKQISSRFQAAYNSLVRAYHEGTLMRGSCAACAVGNIVTDACGGIVTVINGRAESTIDQGQWWARMFSTARGEQTNCIKSMPKTAKNLEELTGYSAHEMAQIEFLFETNTRISGHNYSECTEQQILEDQYNGLEAVVNYLLTIEEKDDTGEKAKLKAHPKLVTV